MTGFEELAKVVARGFKEVMDEEGFETFDDMKYCYQMDTQDIKEEVDFYLKDATDGDACIGDDGADVYYHGTDMMIRYRKFATMWRKELKQMK